MTYKVPTELYKHRWVGNTWPVIVYKKSNKSTELLKMLQYYFNVFNNHRLGFDQPNDFIYIYINFVIQMGSHTTSIICTALYLILVFVMVALW